MLNTSSKDRSNRRKKTNLTKYPVVLMVMLHIISELLGPELVVLNSVRVCIHVSSLNPTNAKEDKKKESEEQKVEGRSGK